jgi:hypothetical protein
MCDGKNGVIGKKRNPVTLVKTVVKRKIAVHPSKRFPAISPNVTMKPERIPMRLIATCTSVKVDIPEIILHSLSKLVW